MFFSTSDAERSAGGWIAAQQLRNKPVYPVDERRFGKEHEWAIAFNQVYAVLATEIGSLFTDGTLSAAAMHPDAANASFGTIAYDAFGIAGRCHH